MFKAKLIQSEKYHALRSRQVLLGLLVVLPIGVIVNFYKFPIWITMLMFSIYAAGNIIIYRNKKRLEAMVEDNRIEIDDQEIRIQRLNITEKFQIKEVDKLLIKDNYTVGQESIKEISKEITGRSSQNYLVLKQNDEEIKLDFVIDSYYMINQLNRITKNWKTKGYNIEVIS